jgi:hypothetical protein
MTEQQQYRVIVDRDKGDEPLDVERQPGDLLIYEQMPCHQQHLVRIERPVPTTDEPPVADTSSGEHRRVIRHVGDDLPICDTCINVLGLNVRWDHAVLRHEREGITPAEPQPSPSVPTREQIAAEIKRVTHAWSGPSMDEFINDPPTRKQYAMADAVLALLQKGADR